MKLGEDNDVARVPVFLGSKNFVHIVIWVGIMAQKIIWENAIFFGMHFLV